MLAVSLIIAALIIAGTVSIILMFKQLEVQPIMASDVKSEALSFVKNVLPIDTSQYNMTLKRFVAQPPSSQGLVTNALLIAVAQEFVTYNLNSKDSSIDVYCAFTDNSLSNCNIYIEKGSITGQSYSSNLNAAKDFLEKYQDYSGLNSTEMINMLSNADPTKNSTKTSGNLSLTIKNQDSSDNIIGGMTDFRWEITINGCNYPALEVSFSNGFLYSLIDQRALYSTSSTTVNISKEKAIDIAMQSVGNYSYQMPNGAWVSGFQIKSSEATLVPLVRYSNSLYPCWQVKLYADKMYPGSVNGFWVSIWADNGQVYSINGMEYYTPSGNA